MTKAKYTPVDLATVSDNLELTEKQIAEAVPFDRMFPALREFIKGSRTKPADRASGRS